MENDELLHKWVNGQLTAEELKVFKLRPEYESLVELYAQTKDLKPPEFAEQRVLETILKTDKNRLELPAVAKTRQLATWMRYAAAAVVVLSLAWFFWPSNSMVRYEVAKGERKEGVLPDESTFVLNSESSLSFDSKNWNKARKLHLHGEVFFKVKKGAKFSVQTPNGTVQVLGTQFNVWSRAGVLEVKCKSGKVAVLSTKGKVLEELSANEAIRIKADQVEEKWPIQAGNNSNWMNGISRFRKAKLQVVLDELARQFDVNIDAAKVNTDEVISCNFQHKNLELALQTTLGPLNILYEIRDGGVVYLYR